MGELGLLRGLFGGAPTSRRATPPRCSCACCANRSRRSTARPRPRSRCRAWAATRSCSPVRPNWPRGGCRMCVSGEAVAAFALSEPKAGSDAAALELRADADGDGWRLTGEKIWISNAPDADIYTVFARTTPGARARGVTAFAVPGDSPGLSGEPLDMLSPHPIGRLVFDGVRVERDACSARSTPVSWSPCARWTCSGPASARSRSAWRRPRWTPPSSTCDNARFSARRWPTSRPSRTASPTWPPSSRPRGCWSTRRPSAYDDGRRTAAADPALGDGQAVRHRGRAVDHRRRGPAARRGRPAARPPARTPLPRRPVAAHLRGRLGDPAHHHRPRPDRQGPRPMTELPLPRLRAAHRRLAALPLRQGRRRRHGHPGPAGEAEPADLRELRRPARPAGRAAAPPGRAGAGHPRRGARRSAAAATSTRSSAS